ncbi:glutamate-1-semialdehyde aminotransferase, partial [candidate division MSBL1 archaeon SCGC-AAA261D19]
VKSPGIPESIRETTLVAPFNDLERVKSLSEENELAAIVVEPVMGNAGCIPPEDGFLDGLRDICNDNNILLFFDEVITGFRLSLGGAQEYFNVTPDLVTLGKIIGGGFPIGAFAGKKDIMKLVEPEGKVFHAGTFSGHPITMTAGLATLKELENQKVIDKTTKYAEELAETLREESGKTVNQIASMLQIFFTESEAHTADDVRATDKKAYKRFHQALLKKGVFIPPARSECWFVSSAHSKEDLKITKEVLKETFSEFE